MEACTAVARTIWKDVMTAFSRLQKETIFVPKPMCDMVTKPIRMSPSMTKNHMMRVRELACGGEEDRSNVRGESLHKD